RAGAGADEEGRQAPEVLLLPAGEGVVVALRTAQAHAEETPGHGLGDALRAVAYGEVKGRGAAGGGVPLGGQHRPGHLVERRVLAELGAQPGFERPAGVAGWRQRAGPEPGEVLGVAFVFEEAVDQPIALAGARRAEEVAGLGDARDGAGQLEVSAAEENAVVGRRAGRQGLWAPGRLQPAVDPGGQLRRAFAGTRGGQPQTEEEQGQHGTPSTRPGENRRPAQKCGKRDTEAMVKTS